MSDEIPITFSVEVDASVGGVLFEHAWLAAKEREAMGFVWCGDKEIDPRFMDSDSRCSRAGRVMWGRDRDGGLWAREANASWHELSEREWAERYPFSAVPPRLLR